MYVKFDRVSKDAGGQGEVRIWRTTRCCSIARTRRLCSRPSSYSDHFYLFTYWNGNGPRDSVSLRG